MLHLVDGAIWGLESSITASMGLGTSKIFPMPLGGFAEDAILHLAMALTAGRHQT